MDDPRSPLDIDKDWIAFNDPMVLVMPLEHFNRLFNPAELDERDTRVERLRRLRRKKHKTKPKTVGKWRRKPTNFYAVFGKKRPSKAWRRHVRRSKQER